VPQPEALNRPGAAAAQPAPQDPATGPDGTAACVFCRIVVGADPATIVRRWPDALALTPLDPYTFGHLLVVSRAHVRDAAQDPAVTGMVMARAAQLAADTMTSANILTSWGVAATQTVRHLHVHVVPRVEGDREWLGLWPWPRWAALVLEVPSAPAGTIAGRPMSAA
jgi:histidine triad (HIT) family protein